MRAAGQADIPWGTHTIKAFNDVYECNFNPDSPNDEDAHGREFGTLYPEDSARTDAAILAVYNELVARAQQREGQNLPISLDTPLVGMAGAPTLRTALSQFVHGWLWSDPTARRNHTDQIVAAILAQRQPLPRVYVPLVVKH